MNPRNDAAIGKCYAASWHLFDLVEDRMDEIWLCHGVVRMTAAPFELMGHAWIEGRIGPVLMVMDALYPSVAVPRERYYALGQIDPASVVRYDAKAKREMTLLHEHYGPWHEPLEDQP